MRKLFTLLPFFILLAALSPAIAQRRPKSTQQTPSFTVGTRKIKVRGTLFNQIDYNFSPTKSRNLSYYLFDASRKTLVLTEVSQDLEDGVYMTRKIETFTCPFDAIDKTASYIIEMDDEAVTGGKYFRLTLVTKGAGADRAKFKSVADADYLDAQETKAVEFVLVNVIAKADADKWLRKFVTF